MSLWARRLTAVALLALLVVAGLFSVRWQTAIDELFRPAPAAEDVVVELFFADGDAQCLLVESRAVPVPAGIDPDGDEWFAAAAAAALAALAEGPRDAELWPTIPPGAQVLAVALRDGVAAVDYSKQLRTNHGGGSAGELLTVGSIAGTLASFPGVEAVQILLEGEPVETLAGHLSLLEPVRIAADALAAGKICWDGIQ